MDNKEKLTPEDFILKISQVKNKVGLVTYDDKNKTFLFSPHPNTYPYMKVPQGVIESITPRSEVTIFIDSEWKRATYATITLRKPDSEQAQFYHDLHFNLLNHLAMELKDKKQSNASAGCSCKSNEGTSHIMNNPNDPKCGCPNNCLGDCQGGVCHPNWLGLGCV